MEDKMVWMDEWMDGFVHGVMEDTVLTSVFEMMSLWLT